MLADKIKRLMDLHDMSIIQLAEKADLPVETVRNIVYKRTTDPKGSTLLALSHVFYVSVNSLLGEDFVTAEEKELLMLYRDCGRHGRSVLRTVAKYEASIAKTERKSSGTHMVPIVEPRGSVEDGIFFGTCKTEDYKTTVHDAFMAVLITTNNFTPVYFKDDIVLLADRFPKDGECAFWRKGEVLYCRRYEERATQAILRSFNKVGKDMPYNRASGIELFGTCIGIVNKD